MPVFNQAVFHYLTPKGRTANTQESSSTSGMTITGMQCRDDCLDFGIDALLFQCSVFRGDGCRWGFGFFEPYGVIQELLHVNGKVIDCNRIIWHEIGDALQHI